MTREPDAVELTDVRAGDAAPSPALHGARTVVGGWGEGGFGREGLVMACTVTPADALSPFGPPRVR